MKSKLKNKILVVLFSLKSKFKLKYSMQRFLSKQTWTTVTSVKKEKQNSVLKKYKSDEDSYWPILIDCLK